jgi:hypothetical protein
MHGARFAGSNSNTWPLLRLKLLHVWPMVFLSGVPFLTGSRCNSLPTTKGHHVTYQYPGQQRTACAARPPHGRKFGRPFARVIGLGVRCAFLDGIVHSMMSLSVTSLLRLKLLHACGQ